MKLFLTILALICAGCAAVQAEPPAHKTYVAYVTVPAGVPVDSVNLYAANHADTNWTRIVVLTATNGITASTPLTQGVKFELYMATSTNSATGAESDYGTIWTNNIPSAPTTGIK